MTREGYVSKNFTFREMSCRCGCGIRNVSNEAIRKLQALRDTLGMPLVINSAARCPKHNKDIGGAPKSHHISTKEQSSDAFDVAIVGLLTHDKLINAAMAVGFKGIGVGGTFVHIDDRPEFYSWKY